MFLSPSGQIDLSPHHADPDSNGLSLESGVLTLDSDNTYQLDVDLTITGTVIP